MAFNPNFDRDVALARIKRIESLLDGGLEHMSHAVRALELSGKIVTGASWPPAVQGEVGSVEYHAIAALHQFKQASDHAQIHIDAYAATSPGEQVEGERT